MTKSLVTLIGCLFLLSVADLPVSAGQVVTQKERIWAQSVLESEKSREFIFSPNTLAVLYFHNRTDNKRLDPLQKGLAYMLISDLSQLEEFQLVERVKLQALVEEMDLGVSGLVDDTTAPRVGRLLGARYLVGGAIYPGKISDLSITSSILEVKKEDLIGRPSAEGLESTIFQMEKLILFEIIDLLDIALTPEQKVKLEKPITTNINALINLCNAIDSSDRGNYSKAENYYKNALNQDPELAPALDGLKELQQLNLTTSRKRSRSMLKNLESKTSTTDSITQDYSTRQASDPGDLEKREDRAGDVNVRW
jgi:TolB-like protein